MPLVETGPKKKLWGGGGGGVCWNILNLCKKVKYSDKPFRVHINLFITNEKFPYLVFTEKLSITVYV